MPVNYNINEYADKQEQETYTKNRWLLSPSASASWIANKKFTVSVNGGWKKLPENSNGFFSSPMLSSFPFIQTGLADFQNAETSNAGILVRYKNILKGLFWNASYNRSWRHGDLMATQDFEDGYIVNGFTRNPHTAKSDNVFGSISYMLDFMKGGASLRGVYSHSDSYFVQSGEQQYSVSSMKQLGLNVYSSPLRILDVDYTFSFSNNTYRLEEKRNSSTNTMQQKLLLTFIPTQKMNVAVTGNHYYNTLDSGNRNTFLLDADANYRLSSKWSFRLSAQNLLNQKTFSYISYTDMVSVEKTYKIRPFSLLFSVITHF